MIDSLLEELPQPGVAEEVQTASASDTPGTHSSENSFLAALPIVQRIVGRRRARFDSTNASDLVQEVALRLWRWRTNHKDTSEKMSGEEWNSFAARTAYNEVNRHFSGEKNAAKVPLELVSEVEEPSVEGQTEIEVSSLIHQVWQGICELSSRQRRALLLHSQELIIHFLQSGITDRDLAEALQFHEDRWYEIRNQLPMTDAQIARETEGRLIRPSTAGSVKKARYEARVKLEGLIRK
jgi:DNA-directed RNA polymerase specialized sigma24 family protein